MVSVRINLTPSRKSQPKSKLKPSSFQEMSRAASQQHQLESTELKKQIAKGVLPLLAPNRPISALLKARASTSAAEVAKKLQDLLGEFEAKSNSVLETQKQLHEVVSRLHTKVRKLQQRQEDLIEEKKNLVSRLQDLVAQEDSFTTVESIMEELKQLLRPADSDKKKKFGIKLIPALHRNSAEEAELKIKSTHSDGVKGTLRMRIPGLDERQLDRQVSANLIESFLPPRLAKQSLSRSFDLSENQDAYQSEQLSQSEGSAGDKKGTDKKESELELPHTFKLLDTSLDIKPRKPRPDLIRLSSIDGIPRPPSPLRKKLVKEESSDSNFSSQFLPKKFPSPRNASEASPGRPLHSSLARLDSFPLLFENGDQRRRLAESPLAAPGHLRDSPQRSPAEPGTCPETMQSLQDLRAASNGTLMEFRELQFFPDSKRKVQRFSKAPLAHKKQRGITGDFPPRKVSGSEKPPEPEPALTVDRKTPKARKRFIPPSQTVELVAPPRVAGDSSLNRESASGGRLQSEPEVRVERAERRKLSTVRPPAARPGGA